MVIDGVTNSMKISRRYVQKECPIVEIRQLDFFLLAAHQVKPGRLKYRVSLISHAVGHSE